LLGEGGPFVDQCLDLSIDFVDTPANTVQVGRR
jgi:hypothetical protein